MNFTVIIPSRYQSSRLPGKPLIDLAGCSMIERVWIQATKSGANKIIIATDDRRIEDACSGFNANVCLTSSLHQSGTDRLAEVIEKMCIPEDEIIINVQGDEPLIPVENIVQVATLLEKDPDAFMATLSTPITSIDEFKDPNVVKVVADNINNALYFSRSAIPFDRDNTQKSERRITSVYQRHIGLYGYRAGFLKTFSNWEPSDLEQLEKLEQLRVLSHGYKIKIEQAKIAPPAGIDTHEDVARVEKLLAL